MTDAAKANLLNSPTLVMGLSGSGKSSLLATYMEWLWETYHLVTLYYLCDGGGFPTQVQALIRHGICRVWRMRTRSASGLAFETCQRASQGWWPARINPATGETAPNVQLVPPVSERYSMSCPNGHLVRTVPTQALLTPGVCPTCRLPVNLQNAKVEKSSHRTKGFEKVGGAAYDGLSSMCSWMMDDLSKRDLGGEKSRLGGVVMSGDMMFGENNRAQVGFTQNRAEQLALASGGIPYLVAPPVWTALVQEGSDEGSLTVVGPMIAGQAKTAVAPQWFGNCLEAIVVEREAKKFRRLNLAEYIDATNRRHLCKVRSFPGLMPPHLEDEDKGTDANAQVFENFNLGTFHKLLDQALVRTEESYKARFPDAPGLDEGDVSYGDDSPVGTAPAPHPPVPTVGAPVGSAPVAPRAVPGPVAPTVPPAAVPPPTQAPKPPVVGPQVVGAPPAAAPKPPMRAPVPPPAGRKPTS